MSKSELICLVVLGVLVLAGVTALSADDAGFGNGTPTCYNGGLAVPCPVKPFGGGGGGGWGDPSLSGMILAPGGRMRVPSVTLPWWVGWVVGEVIDWTIQPIKDCISQGTCNIAAGPVGGGGGGGIDPPSTGGGGGWARKALPWNWFEFSEHAK